MLVVENLKFSYKDTTVLNGIDLTAHSGELVGIVGPNGAGKTTLIRAISGVLKPEVGIVKIGDIDLSLLSSSQRAKMVSVVPQKPQLPLSFKVIDLVSMGRNPYLGIFEWESDRDIQIIMRAMDLTDTTHLSQRLVGTLSGGEVQRVLVAMALVQETDVILMDEPTASLDLAYQTGIMDLVKEVKKQSGGVVLVAMHDLTLAAQYCDRLMMMFGGSVYVSGSAEDVLTSDNIFHVYDAEVHIMPHPRTGEPVVLPMRRLST